MPDSIPDPSAWHEHRVPAAQPLDEPRIAAWLRDAFATALGCPAEEIPLDEAPDALGLDSIQTIRILGKLSDWLGHECESTLFFEHDTIAAVAKHLATLLGRQEKVAAPFEAVIAASFTAEPLAEPLAWHLDALYGASAIAFMPYNQIFQALLDPTSRLNTTAGVAIVLARVEDWYRYAATPPDDATIARTAVSFLEVLEAACAARTSPLLVALCPSEDGDRYAAATETIRRGLTRIPHVVAVDLASLDERYGLESRFDRERDALGHIPFTHECFAAIAGTLARAIYARRRVPPKVVVLDCDNTLWDGVCGEDGARGVRVGPARRALQAFMRAQHEAGRLLCLCSKNIETDVWEVFEQHPDMVLRRDQITAWQINWQAKSANLRALAKTLDLGLDAFVFVDDNPAECAEVRANAPEVTVVELPLDADEASMLVARHWVFDRDRLTAEDAKRAESYRHNQAREQLRASAGTFEDFLAQLELSVAVTPLAEADLPRAAQLTERTNQFNATTKRRSEAELSAWLADARRFGWRVSVRDRFGDYGFVGLMLAERQAEALVVETFLLSCRVLGKRVEHTMLQEAARHAATLGLDALELPFAATKRNQPLRAFYEALHAAPLPEGTPVRFALDTLARRVATAVSGAPAAEQGEAPTVETPASSQALDLFAGLEDAAAILARLRGHRSARPELATPYAAPRTLWQRKLAELWAELLGIARVGIQDSFFDLGGDSIMGADLTAALWRLGVPDAVALSTLESPTIAALAEAIESAQGGQALQRSAALISLEAHAVLDDSVRVDTPPVLPERLETIFVTGGTGYVGAFLLAGLLRHTQATLLCHVRARSAEAGLDRLVGNLGRYELWNPAWRDRLVPILGDLQRPALGMSAADWERIAGEADALYHNGAWVNFVFPYEKLAAANVEATRQVLDLARHRRIKPLHFVSTLGVLMSGGYGRDRRLFEDDALDHSEDLPNGYEQTKWVADKLVKTAMERGLPASIYRLGMLSGLGESGTYHKLDEFLPSFLKGCVQLGSFPMIHSKIEMVPADFVVEALVRISLAPERLGKVYQMNHPDAMTDAEFVSRIRALGYPLRHTPWDVWKRELFGAGPALRDNALYPYLEFLRGLQEHQTYMPEMDMGNFLSGIAGSGLACLPQSELLRRYFAYFTQVGYLPAPADVLL